jgi:hypothetical protein
MEVSGQLRADSWGGDNLGVEVRELCGKPEQSLLELRDAGCGQVVEQA